MKNYIIAHDLGTTGNKATLYDREGKLVGSTFEGYPTEYAQTNWAEQDPEDWWRAVCNSTHKLLQETKTPAQEIACIVFSGQMMGCVALDKKAQPLRNAIIWADQRAVPQERWVSERVAPEVMYWITGHRLSASYTLNKILWLRDNQPDIYKTAYKFMQAKDAIVARLTGAFVTEPSDASSLCLYDLQKKRWSEQIVEATELNPDQLPEIRPSIGIIGEVSAKVAAEAGVAAGTPVVIGGGDGACAAAGAGVVSEGSAYNYIGSSSWIAMTSDKPIYDAQQRTFTFAHVVPDKFMPTGTVQAAGASYQWTRDQLGQVERQAAEALGISPYELLNLQAGKSPVGANGLFFLPYLMGERTPWWNPNARGAFVGLTIRHTRTDMIRAVLEGVAMNLRFTLDAFRGQGTPIQAMRVIGGGARGRFWNQMMADVYGLPVQRLAVLEEATSMGAAVIGGVGIGLYPDFSMAEQMNQVAETFPPNPAAQATYNQLYPIFEATYRALEPVYERMAELK